MTVANAVSNSLVAAANELMRNRFLNATCPQCQLTAGPDAVVCSTCNNAYHRQCARVRGARGDLWRCLRCRSQNPTTAQRGGRRGVVISPLSRVRKLFRLFTLASNDSQVSIRAIALKQLV